MDKLSLLEIASIVGGFGTAIAAVFAVLGVVMAVIQVRSYRSIQRENNAKTLFREYLKEALERPEFLTPDHDELRNDGRWVQYELFVAHLLYSLDAVLGNTSKTQWREVARGEVDRHTDFLTSRDFQDQRRYYSAELIGIIDDASKRGG